MPRLVGRRIVVDAWDHVTATNLSLPLMEVVTREARNGEVDPEVPDQVQTVRHTALDLAEGTSTTVNEIAQEPGDLRKLARTQHLNSVVSVL